MAGNQNDHRGSGSQGGSHEQHVKAGEQSHKSSDSPKSGGSGSSSQGGSHEQHVKAGEQSRKRLRFGKLVAGPSPGRLA